MTVNLFFRNNFCRCWKWQQLCVNSYICQQTRTGQRTPRQQDSGRTLSLLLKKIFLKCDPKQNTPPTPPTPPPGPGNKQTKPQTIQGTIILIKQKERSSLPILTWENGSRLMTHKTARGEDIRLAWVGGRLPASPLLACRGQRSQTVSEALGLFKAKFSMGQIRFSWHLSHHRLATIILLIISSPSSSSLLFWLRSKSPLLWKILSNSVHSIFMDLRCPHWLFCIPVAPLLQGCLSAIPQPPEDILLERGTWRKHFSGRIWKLTRALESPGNSRFIFLSLRGYRNPEVIDDLPKAEPFQAFWPYSQGPKRGSTNWLLNKRE